MNELFSFQLPIPVVKKLEPILIKYFGYTREMFFNEFSHSFYANYPNGEADIPNKEEYIIDFPQLDEYAIDEGVFDYKRYAPRKPRKAKLFDIVSYMINTPHDITFAIDNGNLPNEIEDILARHDEPDKDDVIGIVLLLVAVIYSKYQKGELSTDIALTEDTRPYVTKVRPEMLKLYEFLRSGIISPKTKLPKPITLIKGNDKITLDNSCCWLTDLLDDYLHIYLGVNNLEEAQRELQEVYAAKKGRKATDMAYNLILFGTFHLLQQYSSLKTKSEQIRLTLSYMNLLFEEDSFNDDENSTNATLSYLIKQGYIPKWKPKQLDDYNLSPNNPTISHYW